jgi:hypothetical protein
MTLSSYALDGMLCMQGRGMVAGKIVMIDDEVIKAMITNRDNNKKNVM